MPLFCAGPTLAALASLTLHAAPAPSAGEKPKLLVLELTARGAAPPELAASLTDALAASVGAQGYFQVLATKEVQAMLGVERQRQLLGCGEEGSCLTELAGAIGARLALSGSLTRLGDAYQLSLQMVDSSKAQTLGRSVRIAKGEDALRRALPWAIAEATGTPPPPRPSHLLPYGLMVGGTGSLVFGGVLGVLTLQQRQSLSTELALGEQGRAVLKPYSYYQQQSSQLGNEQWGAIAASVAGVALVGLGVFLNPSDAGEGGAKLALVPAPRGGALVATW